MARQIYAVVMVELACLTGMSVAQGSTVTVSSAAALTDAVWNTSVSVIVVSGDIKMYDDLPRWHALPEDMTLDRNLTITGLEGEYPLLDLHYWRVDASSSWKPKDNYTAKGIRLAPGITITFRNLLFKRIGSLVPDMLVGGTEASLANVENCIIYRYICGPLDYTMNLYLHTPRPAWATNPSMHTGTVLPSGFCRAQPYPPLYWERAFMLFDWASDWSDLATIPENLIFKVQLVDVAYTCFSLIDVSCYDKFFNGNISCLSDASNSQQQLEIDKNVTWLDPPATQQQINAANAGVAQALQDYQAWLTSINNQRGMSRKKRVGIAVGVSIGGAVLLGLGVCAVLAHMARAKRNADALHKHHMTKNPVATIGLQLSGTPSIDGAAVIVTIKNVPHGTTDEAEHGITMSSSSGRGIVGDSTGSQSTEVVRDAQGAEKIVGRTTLVDTDSSEGFQVMMEGKGIDMPHLHGLEQRSPELSAYKPEVLLQLISGQFSMEGQESSSSPLPNTDHFDTDSSTLVHLKQMVTPDTSVPDTLLTDVQLGTDVILSRKLGSGAMGTVYEATFRDTPVAVKLLSPGADLKSFEHELGILGRTRHPNVIRLLAANLTSSSQPLLVEELAHGSLEELLYPNNRIPGRAPNGGSSSTATAAGAAVTLPTLPTPLPMSVVLSLALDIASGLAYLHPTILHRDLKPANVLIVKSNRQGDTQVSLSTPQEHEAEDFSLLAKISDFGLSRMLDAMTIVTQRPHCGTIPYMAPECFNKKGLTHKCDIYSFGVLLWEMIHNVRPWKGCIPIQIVYQVVVKHARLEFTASDDRCPRQLRKLIMRCWDADPYRRPPALEVARELAFIQKHLGSSP